MIEGKTIEYTTKPQGPVLQQFEDCRESVSVIRGPLGSGKTMQVIIKILDLICEQDFCKDKHYKFYNCRPSRVLAVRNTYSELFSTTIKDWLDVHGDLGPFKEGSKQPPRQILKFKLEDGTWVDSEIMFISFDRPDHVKKARGLQPTIIWLNETKELDKSNVDMLDLRHGRYPARNKDGVASTWHGMLGDTNAPDTDHWLYKLAEETKPEGWAFYHQPGGLREVAGKWLPNYDAENLGNLPGGVGYYVRGKEGKAFDWIKVNLANEYGFVSDGKPVHPWYVDSVHCQDIEFTPDKEKTIVLGFDFGRTPACLFLQEGPFKRWIAFDEFLGTDIGAVAFSPELKKYIDSTYPGHKFKGWGDPSGDNKGQASDDTPFKLLNAAGIPCQPTETNAPKVRRAALEVPMKEMCMDGKPRFILLPKCKVTRKGMQGGFKYRRVLISEEKYSEEPDKNEYSHPVEALEYALQGEGEGRSALIRADNNFNKPVILNTGFNVFE